jgi:hypothetical protein
VWLNPLPANQWAYTHSIGLIARILREPHVPAHPRGHRRRDARARAVSAAALTYRQKAAPASFEVTYTLKGDRLVVDSGRKVDEVRLDAVSSIRLTYDPRSFAQRAYVTRVTLITGRTIRFSSVHWRSMIEAATQPGYGAFVARLVQAVAAANPGVALVAGKPRTMWLASAGLTLATFAAIVAFVGQALAAGSPAAAGFGALIGLTGLWQLEPMVRLNRPRVFAPESVPRDLLP